VCQDARPIDYASLELIDALESGGLPNLAHLVAVGPRQVTLAGLSAAEARDLARAIRGDAGRILFSGS
jgi:hypothetical protein